jgi:hypothetical protein
MIKCTLIMLAQINAHVLCALQSLTWYQGCAYNEPVAQPPPATPPGVCLVSAPLIVRQYIPTVPLSSRNSSTCYMQHSMSVNTLGIFKDVYCLTTSSTPPCCPCRSKAESRTQRRVAERAQQSSAIAESRGRLTVRVAVPIRPSEEHGSDTSIATAAIQRCEPNGARTSVVSQVLP